MPQSEQPNPQNPPKTQPKTKWKNTNTPPKKKKNKTKTKPQRNTLPWISTEIEYTVIGKRSIFKKSSLLKWARSRKPD